MLHVVCARVCPNLSYGCLALPLVSHMCTHAPAQLGCNRCFACRVAQVATAEVSGLQLLAPPVIPAFTPTSQPGVLVTMPYRQVYAGEVITVSVQAVNPLMQGITGFTLPLQYDKTLLEFREARSGDLWQEATVTTQAAGGNLETAVLSAGRSGTQSDTA